MTADRGAREAHRVVNLNYPDFVAFIGQENTPPGAEETVSWWIEHGAIGRDSTVLDLACTTGFSGRSVAEATGCLCHGIDLSRSAIREARARARADGLATQLRYEPANVTALPFRDHRFTHVLAGTCFAFFEDRLRALDEVVRVLRPGGKLCIATFYYTSTPPKPLQRQVAQCLGFSLKPNLTREFWNRFFRRRFDLAEEIICELPVFPPDAVHYHSAMTILERSHDWSVHERKAAFSRLVRDRLVFNEHRRHQAYARSVWVPRS